MGQTSEAYVTQMVWKIPHGRPQRISAARSIWTFWAVKKRVMQAESQMRQPMMVYR
jgi:hypothetical protein